MGSLGLCVTEGGQAATRGDGVLEQRVGGGTGEEEGLNFKATGPTEPPLVWGAGKGPSYARRGSTQTLWVAGVRVCVCVSVHRRSYTHPGSLLPHLVQGASHP